MKLDFVKMHGCGNDYIYFDGEIENPSEVAIKLSRRHFSVGGDGIVMVCESRIADAKMRMFNADGSEGKMCGNAIRCVGKFLYELKGVKKDVLTVETLSGIKTLWLTVNDGKVESVRVDMGKAELNPQKIPVDLSGEKAVDCAITVNKEVYDITCVSMGNPHCVIFCDKDIKKLNLEKIGPHFEKHELFLEGVNTEFVNIIDSSLLSMRVWERGSGETFACGTGASAVAVAAVEKGICEKDTDITVRLIGGELIIRYTDDGTVYMTGPAEISFFGSAEV